MAQVHGKDGAILVGTADCSPFTNSIDWDSSADTHDTTTFGATGHTYAGGLTDGKVSLKGIYDTTAITGPRAAVQAKLGLTVAFKYRPEGIGTGKPETSCQVVVNSYKESVPVADMVTWEAELTISGAATTTTQS
jgi:hypothetical protein